MKFGERNFGTKHNLVCFPLLVWTWGPTCRPYLVADSDWPAGNTPSGSSICDWLLLDFSWGHGMASRHVGGTLVGPVEEGHSMKSRSLYRGRLVTKNFHLPFKHMYEALNIIK